MKKLYYIICSNYRKFEKAKISYLFEIKLLFSIICRMKCKNEGEYKIKDKISIEIFKTLGLIKNI